MTIVMHHSAPLPKGREQIRWQQSQMRLFLLKHLLNLPTHSAVNACVRHIDFPMPQMDVLLYDLTSTCFECDVPEHDELRKFGYSRDKRSDCGRWSSR